MNYHIGRDGQQLGTFTREQITAGLANGTLRGTDLAWAEGMDDWQPLSGLALEVPVAPLPPPVPGRPVAVGSVSSFSGQPQTCGLAITSLVLGILSFVLSCFTAIPAVICGHMALGKIKRSNGTLAGGGMAIAGLVMGYLFIVMIPLLAGLAIPAFNGVQEKARQMQSLNNARQVVQDLGQYADAHGGKYPASLDEFIKTAPEDQKLLDYPQFKGWTPEKGYEYSAGAKSDRPEKIILMSRSHAVNGRRIVGHNDGSVEIAIPSAESSK